jgi:hypothetical protein
MTLGSSIGPILPPAGSWGGGGSGTVTSFSFVNANGFTGTVATPTTTPTLTLTGGGGSSVVPNKYTLSTVTADPAPGVVGTYYRTNYAASGTFTLPTSPATGSWIKVKQIANNILTFSGTIDANSAFTLSQYDSVELIYNGTTWDAN